MKKLFSLLVCTLLVGLVFVSNINAECDDEDLNEWATKVDVSFTENDSTDSNIAKYAYFLSITPYREDVRIVVIDGKGNKAKGEKYEEINLYGVGAFTNLEEEKYTIEVYGNEGSKCENELLKTLSYTVPRFNRKVKDARCAKHPELEICKTFTNSTKDMTEEQFNKEIDKYIEENNPTTFKDILMAIFGYGLFIIVPIVIVGIYYFGKISKVKKEERNR